MLSSNPLDSYSIAKSLIVAAIVNRNFDRPPRLTELRVPSTPDVPQARVAHQVSFLRTR